VLRRRLLSVLGYSNLLVPREVKRAAFVRMIGHAAAGELTARILRLPLGAAEEAWTRQRSSPGLKLVLTQELDRDQAAFGSNRLAGTGVA
jgi:hypothetical protein